MTDKNDTKSSFGRNIFIEKRQKDTEPHSKESVELDSSRHTSIDTGSHVQPSEKVFNSASEKSTKIKVPVSIKKNDGQVVALHVNENYAVLVSTNYNGAGYTINKVEIEPVAAPSINDDNFMKTNIGEQLFNHQVESVKRIFERSGLNRKEVEVVTALGGKGVVIKQLEMSESELATIENDLPKLMVTSFENSMGRYEYVLLDSTTENGEIVHKVLASCVDTKVFFSLQGMLALAGVKCSIMDLEIMAVVNLFLESVTPDLDEVNCIIDIGTDVSTIIIHAPNAKEELFVRNLDFTFSSFCKIMGQNRECSLHEAEKMIAERNFSEYFTKAFEQETSENLNEIYSIKAYIKRDLLTELQRTFQFYVRKGNRAPGTIYVTGKGLDMKNFAQFMVKNFDVKCEELDVCGFLMGDKGLKEKLSEHRSLVYKAVGLSLRYE